MIEAWSNFILTALGRASDYFYVASAIVSAILLGVLVLVQVRYLGVKSNRGSSSSVTRKTTVPRVTSATLGTAGQIYTQASSKQSDVDSKVDPEDTKPTTTSAGSDPSSGSSELQESLVE